MSWLGTTHGMENKLVPPSGIPTKFYENLTEQLRGRLSNPDEARRAATPAYRQQIAQALFAGIRGYAATLESLRPKAVAPNATVARPTASNSP